MSHADKMNYSVIAVAAALLVLSLLRFTSSSYRELITKKLIFLALITAPLVQVFVFMLTVQIYYTKEIGRPADGFICSGFHGGGLNSGCSIFGAIFEGAMAAVVYSFVSFGLVPLASFLVTLLALVLIKKYQIF